MDHVRREAGGRAYRSDVLLQWVVIGRDPEDAAAEIAASFPGRLTVGQLLDSPVGLLAHDVDQAVKELRRRQQVYGFDSVTTHQPNLEALGEVIAARRAGQKPTVSDLGG